MQVLISISICVSNLIAKTNRQVMMDSSFNLCANQFILEDYVMNFVLLFSHIFSDEMAIFFATTRG
jgi:hypothetical protein